MVDPFFVILAIQQLGEEYVVWDRAAEIDFLAPGRTAVIARARRQLYVRRKQENAQA